MYICCALVGAIKDSVYDVQVDNYFLHGLLFHDAAALIVHSAMQYMQDKTEEDEELVVATNTVSKIYTLKF